MKKIYNKIPTSRLAFYSVILMLLPLFFAGYAYFTKNKEWETVSDRMLAIHQFSEKKARQQSLNIAVRKKFNQIDSFFLDHHVEPLNLLKKEQEALENLIQTPSYTGNEVAEKRYAFLCGEGNHIQFTQGSVQSAEGIQETTEILAHPVEVSVEDLKELLTRIEGNRPNKPLLLITDLKLNKKTHASGNEVYNLNLTLLKREFIQ